MLLLLLGLALGRGLLRGSKLVGAIVVVLFRSFVGESFRSSFALGLLLGFEGFFLSFPLRGGLLRSG